jgi:hypothetical protein
MDMYVPRVHTGYPLSSEFVYFYFGKYKGLQKEVSDKFDKKRREIDAHEKVSNESLNWALLKKSISSGRALRINSRCCASRRLF